jgi:hypothetical protein
VQTGGDGAGERLELWEVGEDLVDLARGVDLVAIAVVTWVATAFWMVGSCARGETVST